MTRAISARVLVARNDSGSLGLGRVVSKSGAPLSLGGALALADDWNSSEGRRLRLQCFERDKARNAECFWCHNPIDYSLGPYRRGGDVMAWSPEHHYPRSTHPPLALEPSNIVPAHFHCNAKRGNRAGLSELGRPTRRW